MAKCECSPAAAPPTIRQLLMGEHRVIERVLDAMDRMVEQRSFDRAFMDKAVEFLRNFADGCHHFKEEDQLFPELERAGLPREGGPIGCMLHEHNEGRSLIRLMVENIDGAESGDLFALEAIWSAVARYSVLLRQHIQKEDHVLFVMAENCLSPEQKSQLLERFARDGGCPYGADTHEQYVRLADQLAEWRFHPASETVPGAS